ncbi:MAG: peptidoglycan DD-metalloendopeptidase family protein [Deltaproteobacteria bacterium]|nr:peptidoglycan DD-metalloendopeptidase family protein [Deltaproteobacteria bacterium]
MSAVCTVIGLLAIYLSSSDVSAVELFRLRLPAHVEILQGEIVELKVFGEDLSAVEGRRGKETIHFYPSRPASFSAIVGADLEAKPGVSKITIKATNQAGVYREAEVILKTVAKSFRQESFTVAEAFDQLSPETLERIRRDRADFGLAFSTTWAPLWEAPFIRPVSQEFSSSFGYRRIINGTPRAPHSGADLRSPIGTEVRAANHGRVVLLGDYFFAGKSVVLNHGGGLYTTYFHLSEFKVEAGAMVRRGDVIALSGMSGRVTGPHLHWGARLGSARVDPFELIHKLSMGQSKDIRELNRALSETEQ